MTADRRLGNTDSPMNEITVRHIAPQDRPEGRIPLNIVLVDARDVRDSGFHVNHVIARIAAEINGPVGINVFDLNAVTTTSDGVAVEGAIIRMAAGDGGHVHAEFGALSMAQLEVTPQLVEEEPHLKQLQVNFPGRSLFRGPNPQDKHVPVHNAVMTGRTVNNNSATEMMNVVTMEEILLPILGQLRIMRDEDIRFGLTGEHISVGIGMTVAEKYGRVFPFRQFRAGDTAHDSGEYAKTLKRHIPCILAPKRILARHIIRALKCGMIPGRHLGCSPAVLATAKTLGYSIDLRNITDRAREELASVGMDAAFLESRPKPMPENEFIEQASSIIPGASATTRIPSSELVQRRRIPL